MGLPANALPAGPALEHQLVFVWGPPMSGQTAWIAAALSATEGKTQTEALFLETQSPQPALEEVLAKLQDFLPENEQGGLPEVSTNIYCELPWNVIMDDDFLEDWIEKHALSQGWNVSFLLLCPFDSERLPDSYRRGMEEFARASRSAVFVVREVINPDLQPPDAKEPLTWENTEALDFGKQLEIFEEQLWDLPIAEGEDIGPEIVGDEVVTLSLPMAKAEKDYRVLMESLLLGDFGRIWGAEIAWRSGPDEVIVFTLSQNKIFQWASSHPSFLELLPMNGAMFHVAGGPLETQKLLSKVGVQTFS